MDPKYKPGVYFGMFLLVADIIINKTLYSADLKDHLFYFVSTTLVFAAAGGFVFGWAWNRIKKQQERNP